MKWMNLCIKKIADYIHTKLPSICQGGQGEKPDFEMSMPLCGICCPIMVHFIGVSNIKSCPLHPPAEI